MASRVAVLIAATAIALGGVSLALRLLTPADARITMLLGANDIGAVTSTGIGALLVVRRPRLIIPWLMCVGGMGLAIQEVLISGMGWLLHEGQSWPIPYLKLTQQAFTMIFVICFQLLLPLLYPDGRLTSRRWRVVAIAVVVVQVLMSLMYMIGPRAAGSPYGPNPFLAEGLLPVMKPILKHNEIIYFSMIAICLLSLLVRLRGATSIERRQIGWLLLALTADLTAIILDAGVIEMVTTAGVAVAIAIAVLRYRLYGIDTLVSRTLVAAGMIAVVGAAYLGVGAIVGLFVSGYDRLGGLAAALLAGVFFQPLRHRLQRLVDRALYGRRGDPQALAELLQRQLRDANPADALARIVTVIRIGLGVTGVVVDIEGESTRVEDGELGDVRRRVPLIWRDSP